MKIKFVYPLFTLLSLSIDAAEISGLKIMDCNIRRTGDMINLNFLIDCKDISLSSNEQLEIQPLMVAGSDTLYLPSLLFTGNIRNKVNQRLAYFNKDELKEDGNFNVKHLLERGNSIITYSEQIPFKDWMYGSRLMLKNTVTGCAECQYELEAVSLAYIPRKLEVNYVIPEPEQKVRHRNVSLYLNFPQGKFDILTDYMNNRAELAKADSLIDELTGDPDIIVDSIMIVGYASPEGKYTYNTRLSDNRATALKKYLERKYTPKEYILTTFAASEDWNGLRKNIFNGNFPYRVQLLAIIDSVSDFDAREKYIRELDNGVTYSNLLQNIYPLLRRVVCDVGYVVRPFTVEEAKEKLSLHPEKVSLNEMYLIAQSYPVGSPEFNGLFAEMLLLYPENIVAKNNLAAVALDSGNINLARKCLENIKDFPSIQNNLGVLFFQEGKVNKAKQCFEKACASGCKEAIHNLKEIETYMAIQ